MENKPAKLAIPAALFLILSTTEMPNYFKYPMLGVAIISLIIGINQYYKEWKATKSAHQKNG